MIVQLPLAPGTDTFDVVQVGYGPVGQATAALLGRHGHRVAVFERHARLYGLPRVGGVDHEVMRILQSLGVAEEFEARAYPAAGFDFLSAEGKPLLHLDWSRPGESGWGCDTRSTSRTWRTRSTGWSVRGRTSR